MKIIRLIACGIGLMAFGAGQAHAGLLNATIDGQYYYPNLSSPLGGPLGPLTVNPTAVFGFGNAGGITFTIGDTTMTTAFAGGGTNGAAFNGAVFTVLSGGSPITGVAIDPATTVLNFDLSRVSFTSTTISENVGGLSFGDRTVTLDLQFGSSAVPEPSTLISATIAVVVGLGTLARKGFATVSIARRTKEEDSTSVPVRRRSTGEKQRPAPQSSSAPWPPLRERRGRQGESWQLVREAEALPARRPTPCRGVRASCEHRPTASMPRSGTPGTWHLRGRPPEPRCRV